METRARRFAGDVSHELRTPLTAMTAVADILGDGTAAPGEGTAAAHLVGQEIRHLNRLVEDLIEISRFDAGSAQLIAEDTGVAAAVQECLRARHWAGVGCTVPAGLTARLDRRRFDVIAANLVGNALRHGAPPVTVRASLQAGRAGGSDLVLEVRDHGPGLPAGAIGHVFDRFYKADSARARSEGSGLGLAIAQENARLHGGLDRRRQPPGRWRGVHRRAPSALTHRQRPGPASRQTRRGCDGPVTGIGHCHHTGAAWLRHARHENRLAGRPAGHHSPAAGPAPTRCAAWPPGGSPGRRAARPAGLIVLAVLAGIVLVAVTVDAALRARPSAAARPAGRATGVAGRGALAGIRCLRR